eukprot:tig00000870_g5147.t1
MMFGGPCALRPAAAVAAPLLWAGASRGQLQTRAGAVGRRVARSRPVRSEFLGRSVPGPLARHRAFAAGEAALASKSARAFPARASAATEEEDACYKLPPQVMVDLVDSQDTPDLSTSPCKRWVLFLNRPPLPTIEDVAQPEAKLAGLRISTRMRCAARVEWYTGVSLKTLSPTPEERPLSGLPEPLKANFFRWSNDGEWIVFAVARPDGLELWSLEVATGKARQLTPPTLNGILGSSFFFLPDNKTLIVKLVPEGHPPAPPPAPLAPSGPVVQTSDGRKAPARTYQDLLKNKHDEECFDWYLAAQVYSIDVTAPAGPSGLPPAKPLEGMNGIIRSIVPSPQGEYLLVEHVLRPYSYTVPSARFPRRLEVRRAADGSFVQEIVTLPLLENIPISFDAVAEGRRSIGWRQDKPDTIYFVEAQDKGDPAVETEVRDIVYTLSGPGFDEPKELARLSMRYGGVTWCNESLCLVSESWWKTRRTRVHIVNPATGERVKTLFDLSSEDRYADPGSPVSRRDPKTGASLLMLTPDKRSIYLSGMGASEEGDRPFIDTLDLATGETRRLWQNDEPGVFEAPTLICDEEDTGLITRVLTRREQPTVMPNFFFRDLATGALQPFTTFPHPYPDLARCSKELIKYSRADGVTLTGTLYLPPDYDAKRDGPLPVLMWAYPKEYKSADAAGQARCTPRLSPLPPPRSDRPDWPGVQVTDSPHRFVRLARAPLYWLTQGYAILDGPAMPIIGQGDAEPNDTFVEQLVANAQAAVDELVRRGVGDRERMAVGGHSYGAFMAANLLCHSRLFRAAVCRSGAYNRTLTPFGFQYEERSFWEGTARPLRAFSASSLRALYPGLHPSSPPLLPPAPLPGGSALAPAPVPARPVSRLPPVYPQHGPLPAF